MLERDQALDALSVIVRDVLERDDLAVHPGLTAKDVPGWDSFKQMEIVMACEERFAMRFLSSELDRLRDLDDLLTVIVRRGVLNAGPHL